MVKALGHESSGGSLGRNLISLEGRSHKPRFGLYERRDLSSSVSEFYSVLVPMIFTP